MIKVPAEDSYVERILKESAFYDIILSVFTASVSLLAVYRIALAGDDFGLLVFLTLSILFVALLKHISALNTALESVPVHELEGCLWTLRGALPPCEGILRMTIHVPIDSGRKLKQIMPYVGEENISSQKKVGRVFLANCGVIGEALRTKGASVANRVEADYEKYIQELVTEWNYTEADAKECNPATQSCIAIPLLHEQTVHCVVFMDTNVRGYFAANEEEVNRMAILCSGIGSFLKAKY